MRPLSELTPKDKAAIARQQIGVLKGDLREAARRPGIWTASEVAKIEAEIQRFKEWGKL